MTFQQKIAWLNLIVAVLAVLTYFVLWPIIGPWRAMSAFGLLGLAGISGLLYWKEYRSDRVLSDERDQIIWLKSFAIAKNVVWVGLILAFLIALEAFGEGGTVPVQGLAMVLWWSFCAFLIVQSIIALIMYRRQ